jgi:hypothetical protein
MWRYKTSDQVTGDWHWTRKLLEGTKLTATHETYGFMRMIGHSITNSFNLGNPFATQSGFAFLFPKAPRGFRKRFGSQTELAVINDFDRLCLTLFLKDRHDYSVQGTTLLFEVARLSNGSTHQATVPCIMPRLADKSREVHPFDVSQGKGCFFS